jgi:hypothetical protein
MVTDVMAYFYLVILFVSIISIVYAWDRFADSRWVATSRLMARKDFHVEWEALGLDITLIDGLLQMICDEFDFKSDLRYRLSPEDSLETIYEIEYPKTPMADGCEIECLCSIIEQEYLVKHPVGEDKFLLPTSLRQLVEMMQKAKVSVGADKYSN